MKITVRLEVSEDLRRAINYRVGKIGKATKDEVESLSKSLVEADLNEVYADWYRATEGHPDGK